MTMINLTLNQLYSMTKYMMKYDLTCNTTKMRQSQEFDTRKSQKWNKTMAMIKVAIPQTTKLTKSLKTMIKMTHMKLIGSMMKICIEEESPEDMHVTSNDLNKVKHMNTVLKR